MERTSSGILGQTSLSQKIQEQFERRSNTVVDEYVGRNRCRGYTRQLVLTALPLLLSDLVAIAASCSIAIGLASITGASAPAGFLSLLYLAVAATIIASFLAMGLYGNVGLHPIYEFRQCAVSTSLVFVLIAAMVTLQSGAIAAALVYPLLLVTLPLYRTALRNRLVHTSWWGIRCLVFSCDRRLQRLFEGHQKNALNGLKPIGFLQDRLPSDCDPEMAKLYLGNERNAMMASVETQSFCALVHRRGRTDSQMLEFVNDRLGSYSRVIIVPDDHRLPSLWALAKTGAVTLDDQLLRPSSQLLKRSLELAICLVSSVVVIPLAITIAVAIKASSGRPIFIPHEWTGRYGRPFRGWHFRTLAPHREAEFQRMLAEDPERRREWEDTQYLEDDPRLTRVGKLLRSTRLEELPLLWNVLKGEMSLVGPRPVPSQQSLTGPFSPDRRVAPGVTGFWRISDQYLESRDRRIELDTFYVKYWSIWFDLYILQHSVKKLVSRSSQE